MSASKSLLRTHDEREQLLPTTILDRQRPGDGASRDKESNTARSLGKMSVLVFSLILLSIGVFAPSMTTRNPSFGSTLLQRAPLSKACHAGGTAALCAKMAKTRCAKPGPKRLRREITKQLLLYPPVVRHVPLLVEIEGRHEPARRLAHDARERLARAHS